MSEISELDRDYLSQIRRNVTRFLKKSAALYDFDAAVLLDVAPQDHDGAAPHFRLSRVETLDIDNASGATWVADLCANNSDLVPSNRFDFVVCTEVLEHTLRPFEAADEIYRVLKPQGLAFVSTPFNFRIHGPLPDCWRFTEHGLRELFRSFQIVELTALEAEDRFLMPIQYTLVAQKPG